MDDNPSNNRDDGSVAAGTIRPARTLRDSASKTHRTMPNHCSNTLIIQGEKDIIDQIRETLADTTREDEDLTFRGVKDRPSEVDSIDCGCRTIDGKKCRRWRETDEGVVPVTKVEVERLRGEYGGADPFEWSLVHWGSKRNGYWSTKAVDEEERLVYEFMSAWAPPDRFLHSLRERFPGASITLKYFEPNMGLEGVL